MTTLLHESWQDDTGSEFGPVRASSDQLRPTLLKNPRLVFTLHASSWFEAMKLCNQRLGYGDYEAPDGVPNHFYSEEEGREQEAYLQTRDV